MASSFFTGLRMFRGLRGLMITRSGAFAGDSEARPHGATRMPLARPGKRRKRFAPCFVMKHWAAPVLYPEPRAAERKS